MPSAAWRLAEGQEVLGQPGVKRQTPVTSAKGTDRALTLAAPPQVTLAPPPREPARPPSTLGCGGQLALPSAGSTGLGRAGRRASFPHHPLGQLFASIYPFSRSA